MFKKNIKFKNTDGVEVQKDFYFNLSRAEIYKMEISAEGNSLQNYFQRIQEEENGAKVWEIFEDLVSKSVGIRSVDGLQFKKSKEISEAFMQTDAFSELLVEMFQNPDAAAEFWNKTADIASVQADVDAKLAAQQNMQGFKKKEAPVKEAGELDISEPTETPVATNPSPEVLAQFQAWQAAQNAEQNVPQ